MRSFETTLLGTGPTVGSAAAAAAAARAANSIFYHNTFLFLRSTAFPSTNSLKDVRYAVFIFWL
jgi:hypothetical protein